MPRKNIVLVVGAGTSHDFEPEMDTGATLITNIINRVNDRDSKDKNLSDLLQGININENQRVKFEKDLEKYKNDHVDGASIDYFLNQKKDEDKYRDIGTFSIAFHILGNEASCVRKATFNKYSWLDELNVFIERCRLNTWGDPLVDLKIVTFNYDRLLEEYLYRKHGAAIESFIANSIVHVYNKIAPLKWQKNDRQDFKNGFLDFGHPNNDIKEILRYREYIRLMYDNRKSDNPHLQTAKNFLLAAHSVLFIGYGYDKYNNDNLELPFVNGKNVFANYYVSEWNEAWKKRYEEFKGNNEIWGNQRDGITFTTETCTNFIRHWLPKAAEL